MWDAAGKSGRKKGGEKKHFKRTKGCKIRNREEIRIQHAAKFQEGGIFRRAKVTKSLHFSKAKTSSKTRETLCTYRNPSGLPNSNEAVLQPSGREHSKNL